jgi:hypothetical protein
MNVCSLHWSAIQLQQFLVMLRLQSLFFSQFTNLFLVLGLEFWHLNAGYGIMLHYNVLHVYMTYIFSVALKIFPEFLATSKRLILTKQFYNMHFDYVL